MQVTKVRIVENSVEIHFQETVGDHIDQHILVSDDAPAPEFDEAFQALQEDLATLCELPNTKANPITVRQVKFKYDGEGYSVVISGKRELAKSNGAMAVNSPNKHSPLDEDAGSENYVSRETAKRLDTVVRHAVAYVNGRRAQLQLFDGGDGTNVKESDIQLQE